MNANLFLPSAPDAIEPVVGWRTWRIVRTDEGLRLTAIAYYLGGLFWPARERLDATCRKFHRSWEHDAPLNSCTCGIHAAKDVRGALGYVHPYGIMHPNVVWFAVGRVCLWGKIIEHEHGYRAQYAYPKQILLPEEIRNKKQEALAPNLIEIADELREAYGVPVLIVHEKKRGVLNLLKGVR